MVNRPKKAKSRNRASYRQHFKYNVQWLMATAVRDFEDPVCFASFRSLSEALVMHDFLKIEDKLAYGVEVVPL